MTSRSVSVVQAPPVRVKVRLLAVRALGSDRGRRDDKEIAVVIRAPVRPEGGGEGRPGVEAVVVAGESELVRAGGVIIVDLVVHIAGSGADRIAAVAGARLVRRISEVFPFHRGGRRAAAGRGRAGQGGRRQHQLEDRATSRAIQRAIRTRDQGCGLALIGRLELGESIYAVEIHELEAESAALLGTISWSVEVEPSPAP